MRLYIGPALGSYAVEAVRPDHVRDALNGWMSAVSHVGRKPLSAISVGHILATLRMIFGQALNDGALARNPATAVKMPHAQHREMQTLDGGGIAKLLRAAEGTDLQAPIALMAATGLRRGQALGLLWSDVDLVGGRLRVRRSLEKLGDTVRYKAPKTKQSARTVALAAFAVEALRRHRLAQSELRLYLGARDDDGPVFATVEGKPLDPEAFSKRFARLVQRVGLRIRLHDLRHTYGTLALSSGVDLKTLSASMGHSTITLTANTYLHAADSLQQDAAARIDALLGEHVTGAITNAAITTGVSSVSQAVSQRTPTTKKARRSGLSMVAGPGFEPGTFGL